MIESFVGFCEANIPLKRFLPDFYQKSVLNQYVPTGTGLPGLITKVKK